MAQALREVIGGYEWKLAPEAAGAGKKGRALHGAIMSLFITLKPRVELYTKSMSLQYMVRFNPSSYSVQCSGTGDTQLDYVEILVSSNQSLQTLTVMSSFRGFNVNSWRDEIVSPASNARRAGGNPSEFGRMVDQRCTKGFLA